MNKGIPRNADSARTRIREHFAAFAAVSIFSCWFAVQASDSQAGPYLSDLETSARRARAEFVPDGNVLKSAWNDARWKEFDHDASGKSHYPELQTRVACLWTPANIYVAFSARYDSLYVYEGEQSAVERWRLWERDVVEVFVNPQPDRVNHYYEFEVAPNNQWIDLEIDKDKNPFNDASWDSHFAHAVRVDSKSRTWTTEMRIPVSAMKIDAIQRGAEWRINFFRAAGAGDEQHRKFLAWSIIPDGKTFHVPTRFGILKFVD
jgi:hypothetical protein